MCGFSRHNPHNGVAVAAATRHPQLIRVRPTPSARLVGSDRRAKSGIGCGYGAHRLGPREARWTEEKYQQYAEEDRVQDVSAEGHVDVAVSQPTNLLVFFFQAEDGIRDYKVTGVQTCALPI